MNHERSEEGGFTISASDNLSHQGLEFPFCQTIMISKIGSGRSKRRIRQLPAGVLNSEVQKGHTPKPALTIQ